MNLNLILPVQKMRKLCAEAFLHPCFLAEPSAIHTGWSINDQCKLEAERPLALAGPPLGGRVALITVYSTGLPGLVQAIIKHPCWAHMIYPVSQCPAAGSSGTK